MARKYTTTDIELIDIKSLITDLGTEGAIEHLNRQFKIKLDSQTTEAYNSGYKEGKASWTYENNRLTWLVWILGILLVGFILNLIYNRYKAGMDMDVVELEACSKGNYSVCLSGIERQGFGASRGDMYRKVYSQATGKSIDGSLTTSAYSVKQIDNATETGVEISYGDKTIRVLDKNR